MKTQERELFEQYKNRVMENIFSKPGLYQDIKELEDFIKFVEFTDEVIKEQDNFTDLLGESLNEKDEHIKSLKRRLQVMTRLASDTMKDLTNLTGNLIDVNLNKLNRRQFATYCKQLDDIVRDYKKIK